jgi:hypothetical protein
MTQVRFRTVFVTAVCLFGAAPAFAQAPAAGPVVFGLPSSPRTMALGDAWVAGRDNEVVFYNPAQLIGARGSEFAMAITRHGPASKHATIASSFAAGKMSFTLGWGVQMAGFHAGAGTPYPFRSDVVGASGLPNGTSALFAVGAAVVYKGFRIGGAGKYAFDHVQALAAGETAVHTHAFVTDLGVAHNLFGGVIAASLQNLGHLATPDGATLPIPRQWRYGWSSVKPAGPLDIGVFVEGLTRGGWTSPRGGMEVGYSWIEGYLVTLRVGARRPDATSQSPLSFGAALNADRLTVEYGVQLARAGGRAAQGVTIRWR